MIGVDALVDVLGSAADQSDIKTLLGQIQANKSALTLPPQVKAYPDIVYHNYQSLGLSLQCEPNLDHALSQQ